MLLQQNWLLTANVFTQALVESYQVQRLLRRAADKFIYASFFPSPPRLLLSSSARFELNQSQRPKHFQVFMKSMLCPGFYFESACFCKAERAGWGSGGCWEGMFVCAEGWSDCVNNNLYESVYWCMCSRLKIDENASFFLFAFPTFGIWLWWYDYSNIDPNIVFVLWILYQIDTLAENTQTFCLTSLFHYTNSHSDTLMITVLRVSLRQRFNRCVSTISVQDIDPTWLPQQRESSKHKDGYNPAIFIDGKLLKFGVIISETDPQILHWAWKLSR